MTADKKTNTDIPFFTQNGTPFDKNAFFVIAGPCSVENERQIFELLGAVQNFGAYALRGGLNKMRTAHKNFQGLREESLPIMKSLKSKTKIPFVSEITDPRQIEWLDPTVDVYQVGSRNMYNYDLLKELALQNKPVLLKRSFAATIDEWIKAAEYVTANNTAEVILCERGIRSFDTKTRNCLDLGAVVYLKKHTDFKVIVDPSHGCGRSEMIYDLSLAAAACGADGLMLEVHNDAEFALSDGDQAINTQEFKKIMNGLESILTTLDKQIIKYE